MRQCAEYQKFRCRRGLSLHRWLDPPAAPSLAKKRRVASGVCGPLAETDEAMGLTRDMDGVDNLHKLRNEGEMSSSRHSIAE